MPGDAAPAGRNARSRSERRRGRQRVQRRRFGEIRHRPAVRANAHAAARSRPQPTRKFAPLSACLPSLISSGVAIENMRDINRLVRDERNLWHSRQSTPDHRKAYRQTQHPSYCSTRSITKRSPSSRCDGPAGQYFSTLPLTKSPRSMTSVADSRGNIEAMCETTSTFLPSDLISSKQKHGGTKDLSPLSSIFTEDMRRPSTIGYGLCQHISPLG